MRSHWYSLHQIGQAALEEEEEVLSLFFSPFQCTHPKERQSKYTVEDWSCTRWEEGSHQTLAHVGIGQPLEL